MLSKLFSWDPPPLFIGLPFQKRRIPKHFRLKKNDQNQNFFLTSNLFYLSLQIYEIPILYRCFQQEFSPKYKHLSSVCLISINKNWKSHFLINCYNLYIGIARSEINFYHVTIWIRAWLMMSVLSRHLWYLRNLTSWLQKFLIRRSTVSIKNYLETKKILVISSNCIF